MSEYSSSGLVFFGFGIKESPLLSTDISCVDKCVLDRLQMLCDCELDCV